jgi:cytochrome c-type biogenesis protein
VILASASETVTHGPILIAMGLAALVGLLSFLSPCVLPLVPGYLSYIAGSIDETTQHGRRIAVAGSILFVSGFTVVFVSQGLLFGQLGETLSAHRVAIERVLGGVTVLLGLAFIGKISPLQREFGFRWLPVTGLAGAPLLGLLFGLTGGPCSTPTLGTVLTLSYVQGTATRGAILSCAYCAGLGIPFVAVALSAAWVASVLTSVRRHIRGISLFGGALLVTIGVLICTGEWARLIAQLQTHVGNAPTVNL